MEDLKRLVSGHVLGPKSSSYRQWALAMEKYCDSNVGEEIFWKNMVSGRPEVEIMQNHFGQCFTDMFKIDHFGVRYLSAYGNSADEILLSATGMSVRGCFDGEETQWITMEGHGRPEMHCNLDFSRTIGWFTVMFPVRLGCFDDVLKTLNHTKLVLNSIPNKGIGFNAFRYDANNTTNLGSLPQICYNYLGRFSDQSEKSWDILDKNTGENVHKDNKDPFLLNLNMWSTSSHLHINMESRLDKSICEKFCSSLKRNVIRCVEASMARDFVVHLRKGDNKMAPLFLVHPAGGMVSCYKKIADATSDKECIWDHISDKARYVCFDQSNGQRL